MATEANLIPYLLQLLGLVDSLQRGSAKDKDDATLALLDILGHHFSFILPHHIGANLRLLTAQVCNLGQ